MWNEVEHAERSEALTIPLLQYPLSRIVFITIKDNSQKWKIGKVNDWIRRYSKCYYIVRGTNGGDHYHLIAGIEKDRNMIPVKGKHFHFSNLQDKKEMLFFKDGEDERKLKHYKRQEFLSQTVELDEEEQNIITKIKLMIEKYWRSKDNKDKKQLTIDKRGMRIKAVMAYLKKNLDEPRETQDHVQYKDYIIKY